MLALFPFVSFFPFSPVTFDLYLNTDSPSSWVKCNLDQAGFYRVNYPPSNWKQLAKMLRTTSVQVTSLVCDAFSF